MSLSIALKKIYTFFVHSAGLTHKKIAQLEPDAYLVLMYHRILPAEKLDHTVEPGMYVTPDTFEKHIRYLKKNFEMVPLEAILHETKTESSRAEIKKRCVLTFDDGWLDFYQYAFPLLNEYNVPATVFLPTDFISTDKWFWTDRLAQILYDYQDNVETSGSPANELSKAAEEILNLSGPFKGRLDSAIRILKPFPVDQVEFILESLAGMTELKGKTDRRFLSWGEVREMQRTGFISFGSHTAGHQILTTISHEQVDQELRQSRQELLDRQIVEDSFIAFCYPNGNYDDKVAALVKQNGYDLAVTTQKGWNTPGSDHYRLNRCGVHEDISSTIPMFACVILNLV